jgi:hypothetical protein
MVLEDTDSIIARATKAAKSFKPAGRPGKDAGVKDKLREALPVLLKLKRRPGATAADLQRFCETELNIVAKIQTIRDVLAGR